MPATCGSMLAELARRRAGASPARPLARAAPLQLVEAPASSSSARGHHQLAAALVGDAVLGAEAVERLAALRRSCAP